MGWHNPPILWAEFERRLSGRPESGPPPDGGDAPAQSRKRAPYVARTERGAGTVPYAELHAHSNFSFLDGASHPEELAEEAARLGLDALALTDHDGLYGVVRFAEAAQALGVGAVLGAELSLDLAAPQQGVADPAGHHLLVLARDPEGYRRLAGTITAGQLAGGEKGRPVYAEETLAAAADGHWLVLTGCRKGAVRAALGAADPDGVDAAGRALDHLVDAFGRESVVVELTDSAGPLDSTRNDALAALAARAGLPTVATGNVHYHAPGRARVAAALAAVRARRSLAELDGWLPPAGTACLRSGAEMAARFARYPGAVARAAAYGRECAFALDLVAPNLPDYSDLPPGHTEASWLRALTEESARKKYGPPGRPEAAVAYQRLERELALIEARGFPGYFLIVYRIATFCREAGILCQGRGSAACSAVCYVLGITAVDPVARGLLFERFLSEEREGYPDIDLDIESDRREEAIQHVYATYGRDRAAQVANVITYRPKLAVRDMAKALGYPTGAQDAWSKQVAGWGPLPSADDSDIPREVLDLAAEIRDFPRHLGIHSGGMVICDRPVGEVCPVEWARMADRSVLQWDKDDCARVGLVKFDLLGLGMLSALHRAFDLIASFHNCRPLTLDEIPAEDPLVYDMLCEADSVGVFQVESRAQMATLPRLRPRTFYDLVVEVAIIRPGPIQGGSVHPYLRRRNDLEPVTYLHPTLEPVLKRTKGVPLFQEQLMQIAIAVAGFTPSESDQLRQAIGSKRSTERMAGLRGRLVVGMQANGVDAAAAEEIYDKLLAFAQFGFPESHAVSFALLVYASAWLKRHHPAAFCVALLNSQPMGFYSPQSLVADARRHDVEIRGPDLHASAAAATLERRPDGEPAIRLGLTSVREVSAEVADRIVEGAPYADLADLARRAAPPTPALEALATAGAFGCLGLDRRRALWAAGAVAGVRASHLPGGVPGARPPALPAMSEVEQTVADLWATGVSPDSHPTQFLRPHLDELGVLTAAAVRTVDAIGGRVLVAGAVIHRQQPSTAHGTVFLNLEDETGQVNVICSPGVWARHRRIGRESDALLVRGRLERADHVTNVIAERLTPLRLPAVLASRDFR